MRKLEPAVDLDDSRRLRSFDASDMLGATDRYAEQIKESLREALRFDFDPVLGKDISRILVIGTGNFTVTTAHILRCVLYHDLKVPLLVHTGYHLPGYVDPNTLILVGSYTGNSEEVVSCCDQALNRAQRVIAFTTGGRIGTMVGEAGGLVYTIRHSIKIPAPRAILPHMLAPMLVCLERLGLCHQLIAQAEEAAEVLREMTAKLSLGVPATSNLAKRIALSFFGRFPVIYAAQELTEAVARRWKDELNENSKVISHYNCFPQLHHDEIVGWDCSPELRNLFSLVFIRDRQEDPRISRRMEITKELLRERDVHELHEVWTRGSSRLARILSGIYVGDYASIYLALLYERDPTQVALIDALKREMGHGQA